MPSSSGCARRPKSSKREEGKRICVEIIQQVREIEGVDGVHVMAYRQEETVAELVEEAELLPRPRRNNAPEPASRTEAKQQTNLE